MKPACGSSPGDTKVVERGSGDGVFINTAGLGMVPEGISISAANARPGDVVLLSGAVGDHGLAIMTRREGLQFASPLASDCAPLNGLVCRHAGGVPGHSCAARSDARRGRHGAQRVGATLWRRHRDWKSQRIPIHLPVAAAAELLGLDPLYVANEGKLIAIVPEASAERAACRSCAPNRWALKLRRSVVW